MAKFISILIGLLLGIVTFTTGIGWAFGKAVLGAIVGFGIWMGLIALVILLMPGPQGGCLLESLTSKWRR